MPRQMNDEERNNKKRYAQRYYQMNKLKKEINILEKEIYEIERVNNNLRNFIDENREQDNEDLEVEIQDNYKEYLILYDKLERKEAILENIALSDYNF